MQGHKVGWIEKSRESEYAIMPVLGKKEDDLYIYLNYLMIA